jgi:hypothetical protein
MSAFMAPVPHDGLRAAPREVLLADWISRTRSGEVQVSVALVAVYAVVIPNANGGPAKPMLHVVAKKPTAAGAARNGKLLHALLWLQPADTAEQASADADAAKQRLLAHAHVHGVVRLQGSSIEGRDGGLDLWLDAARLLNCALQPQPKPARRPVLGAWL